MIACRTVAYEFDTSILERPLENVDRELLDVLPALEVDDRRVAHRCTGREFAVAPPKEGAGGLALSGRHWRDFMARTTFLRATARRFWALGPVPELC